MAPISVEVIAPVLTDLRHCSHCEVIFAQTEVGPRVHKEVLDEYPLDLKEDFQRLSDWLVGLAHRHGDALQIKVHHHRLSFDAAESETGVMAQALLGMACQNTARNGRQNPLDKLVAQATQTGTFGHPIFLYQA